MCFIFFCYVKDTVSTLTICFWFFFNRKLNAFWSLEKDDDDGGNDENDYSDIVLLYRQSGSSQYFAIANNAAVKNFAPVYFCISKVYLQGKFLEGGLRWFS